MTNFPTIIIRHNRENLKKCSLRGLEKRSDFRFFTYPKQMPAEFSGYVCLDLEGPELSRRDSESGLLLIDATWRLASKMVAALPPPSVLPRRTLPNMVRTAYPRYQTACVDPDRGLASLEALYVAFKILGWPAEELLNDYYWKDDFLEKNSKYFESLNYI